MKDLTLSPSDTNNNRGGGAGIRVELLLDITESFS
jgi:hypothetical protein